jgi:glycosyltransferase involved in cell wall biosynthesis
MRVLFLSADFVVPDDRGLRVRTLSQLRLLAAMEEVERITFLSLSESEVSSDRLRALEKAVPKVRAEPSVVRPAHWRKDAKSLVRFLALRFLCREPYLVAEVNSREMRGLIRRHLSTESYDIVYLGNIGMTTYLREVRRITPCAGVVLEEHNVEWRIFDRLAESLRPPKRQAAHLEARALRRFERKALRDVDSVIAISKADAEGLRELSRIDSVVVPPFVEVGPPRVESTQAPALGYIGHLGWQPNTYGLDWFCSEVWPLVRERVPNATLTIAGPGLRTGPDGSLTVPTKWSQPGIKTVGFVNDLEDVYRATLALVAPVLGGSGVRMKLLEAMRAGMPTVTTTDGAAGLDVADGREMLVADSPAAFAVNVARVLSDRSLRERLRAGGYAYLDAHHSQMVVRKSLERAVAQAGSRARGSVAASPREGKRP